MIDGAADDPGDAAYSGSLGVRPEIAKHAVLHGFTRREAIARDAMLTDLQRESFGYFVHEVNEANGLVMDKTAPRLARQHRRGGHGAHLLPGGRAARPDDARAGAAAHAGDAALLLARASRASRPPPPATAASSITSSTWRRGRARLAVRAVHHRHRAADGRRAGRGRLLPRPTRPTRPRCAAWPTALYERVEWDWMVGERGTICHGWKPETGKLPWHWEGYDEALILYLLALGSPTHPIPAAVVRRVVLAPTSGRRSRASRTCTPGRCSSTRCRTCGWTSAACRTRSCARTAATTSSTAAPARRCSSATRCATRAATRCTASSAGASPPATAPAPRAGTAAASRPSSTTSRAACPTAPTTARWRRGPSSRRCRSRPRSCCRRSPTTATSSCTWPTRTASRPRSTRAIPSDRQHAFGWVSPYHFGINEGPTVVMIENHRSEMPWKMMRACAPLVAGLRRAGFAGGWLGEIPHDVARAPLQALPVPPDGSVGETP